MKIDFYEAGLSKTEAIQRANAWLKKLEESIQTAKKIVHGPQAYIRGFSESEDMYFISAQEQAFQLHSLIGTMVFHELQGTASKTLTARFVLLHNGWAFRLNEEDTMEVLRE